MKLVFIAGKFSGTNAWEIACNVHRAETAALAALAGALLITLAVLSLNIVARSLSGGRNPK